MQNPWRSFEELPGLTAVPAVWHSWWLDQLPQFQELCLEPDTRRPHLYPCPIGRGCSYALRPEVNGTFTGKCQWEPTHCPDAAFSLADITPLRLSWGRLGRALCRAFDLNPQMLDLPFPATRQIGSWSSDSVPVILTIQCDTYFFQFVVSALGNRLRRPFILFAPTNLHIDAHTQELLANAQAEFFTLTHTTRLTDEGTLAPLRPPGVLFSKLAPKPLDESAADSLRTVLALLEEMDKGNFDDPAPSRVFWLYCVKCLSIRQIMEKLDCPRGNIQRRLALIEKKTGKSLKYFRQFSAHLEKLQVGRDQSVESFSTMEENEDFDA
jgi:hypothetical protein